MTHNASGFGVSEDHQSRACFVTSLLVVSLASTLTSFPAAVSTAWLLGMWGRPRRPDRWRDFLKQAESSNLVYRTIIPAPARQAGDQRHRCRRLRDRRRPRRADHRTRGGAPRAGRWGGHRADRRTPATPASSARASPTAWTRWSNAWPRRRQGAVGALRGRARICAQHDPRNRYAGRRSGGGPAQGREVGQHNDDLAPSTWSDRTSAGRSKAGRWSACATCSRAITTSTPSTPRRRSTSMR